MQVIVSDSSVIIDLAKAGLIEAAFSLPYEFVIPDVMFADELLDLAGYKPRDLLRAGLKTAVLDGDGVTLAFQYAAEHHGLSTNDCFAMALAATINDAILLTGDGLLRMVAPVETVEVRGLLWLCDQMNDKGTVTPGALLEALQLLAEDPLVRLPHDELRKRITKLKRMV